MADIKTLNGYNLVDASSVHSFDDTGDTVTYTTGDSATPVKLDVYTSTKVDKLIAREYLNVLDFMEEDDALTDATAFIKRATEAAIKQKKSLYFPSGEYFGDVDFNLNSFFPEGIDDAGRDLYIDIFGDGRSTIIVPTSSGSSITGIAPVGQTPVTYHGISFAGCDNSNPSGKLRNIRNFRIRDLSIRGASPSDDNCGIEIYDAQNVEVSNVSIQNCGTGIKLSGAMDFNFVNIDVRDCSTGISMASAHSESSGSSRSCNAVKFTNTRVENCPKLVKVEGNSYGVTFDNYKMESARPATTSPVEIGNAKGITFSNGHMVYSQSHDSTTAYGKVNNDACAFISVADYNPSEQTLMSTGKFVTFSNINFCCPTTWVGRMFDGYRTRFIGCTFNGLDCSTTHSAILGHGDYCEISDCTINNSYKGDLDKPNDISGFRISRCKGTAEQIASTFEVFKNTNGEAINLLVNDNNNSYCDIAFRATVDNERLAVVRGYKRNTNGDGGINHQLLLMTINEEGSAINNLQLQNAANNMYVPLNISTAASSLEPLKIRNINQGAGKQLSFCGSAGPAIAYVRANSDSTVNNYASSDHANSLTLGVHDEAGTKYDALTVWYNQKNNRLETRTIAPLEAFANDNRIATTEFARALSESAKRLISHIMLSGGQIKLIGDSITSGQGGTGFDNQPSGGGVSLYTQHNQTTDTYVYRYSNVNGHCWANSLKDYMTQYGYSGVKVKNYGISGIRSHILKMLVDPEGTNYHRPASDVPLIDNDKENNDSDDLVICMVGTNDRGEVPANPSENYGGELRDNILYMYNYLKGLGKDVIFMSNIPAGASNEALSPRCNMDKINRIIVSTCAWNNIPYISMYQLFKDWLIRTGNNLEDYLTQGSDHLHPNDNGYDVMFELLADALGFTVPYSATSKLIPSYLKNSDLTGYLTSTQANNTYYKTTGGNINGNVGIRNTNLTRGTAPTSDQTNTLSFVDTSSSMLSAVRNTVKADGSQDISLITHNGTKWGGQLSAGIDKDGNIYTSATTPAATSNSTDIATTKWVRDTCLTQTSVYTTKSGTLASIPNNTATEVTSFTLTKGVYSVRPCVLFKSSNTGHRDIWLSETEGGSWINQGRYWYAMQGTNSTTNSCTTTFLLNVTAESKTYHFVCNQNSNTEMTGCVWTLEYVKLA